MESGLGTCFGELDVVRVGGETRLELDERVWVCSLEAPPNFAAQFEQRSIDAPSIII